MTSRAVYDPTRSSLARRRAGPRGSAPAGRWSARIRGGPLGGQVFPILDTTVTLIGRAGFNHVVLPDPRVSAAHCVVAPTHAEDTLALIDVRSRRGTLVNGHPLDKGHVRVGDTITVGPFVLELVQAPARPASAPWRPPADGRAWFELLPRQNGANGPPCRLSSVVVVGRSRLADLRVRDPLASRFHCLIALDATDDGPLPFVIDLRSRGRTYINDRPIHRKHLRPGDVLAIGLTQIELRPLQEPLRKAGRPPSRQASEGREGPSTAAPPKAPELAPLPIPVSPPAAPVLAQEQPSEPAEAPAAREQEATAPPVGAAAAVAEAEAAATHEAGERAEGLLLNLPPTAVLADAEVLFPAQTGVSFGEPTESPSPVSAEVAPEAVPPEVDVAFPVHSEESIEAPPGDVEPAVAHDSGQPAEGLLPSLPPAAALADAEVVFPTESVASIDEPAQEPSPVSAAAAPEAPPPQVDVAFPGQGEESIEAPPVGVEPAAIHDSGERAEELLPSLPPAILPAPPVEALADAEVAFPAESGAGLDEPPLCPSPVSALAAPQPLPPEVDMAFPVQSEESAAEPLPDLPPVIPAAVAPERALAEPEATDEAAESAEELTQGPSPVSGVAASDAAPAEAEAAFPVQSEECISEPPHRVSPDVAAAAPELLSDEAELPGVCLPVELPLVDQAYPGGFGLPLERGPEPPGGEETVTAAGRPVGAARPRGARRRRWAAGLLVFAAGAAAAVALVWSNVHPQYRAAATVQVTPILGRTAGAPGESAAADSFAGFVDTQVAMAASDPVLRRALSHPEVRQCPQVAGQADPLSALRNALEVERIGSTHLFAVAMRGDSPHGLAPVVNAVAEACVSRFQESERAAVAHQRERLEAEQRRIGADVAAKAAELARFRAAAVTEAERGLASDDPELLAATRRALAEAQAKRASLRTRLDARRAALAAKEAQVLTAQIEEAVAQDPELRRLEELRDTCHPQVLKAEAEAAAPPPPGLDRSVSEDPRVLALQAEKEQKELLLAGLLGKRAGGAPAANAGDASTAPGDLVVAALGDHPEVQRLAGLIVELHQAIRRETTEAKRRDPEGGLSPDAERRVNSLRDHLMTVEIQLGQYGGLAREATRAALRSVGERLVQTRQAVRAELVARLKRGAEERAAAVREQLRVLNEQLKAHRAKILPGIAQRLKEAALAPLHEEIRHLESELAACDAGEKVLQDHISEGTRRQALAEQRRAEAGALMEQLRQARDALVKVEDAMRDLDGSVTLPGYISIASEAKEPTACEPSPNRLRYGAAGIACAFVLAALTVLVTGRVAYRTQ